MAIVAKIAAVSYLNTIPFIHGIRHEGSIQPSLQLAPPSECARLFVNQQVDIALVPAAIVPSLRSTELITDYCIGAVRPVRTVVVVSNTPISQVRRIYMDSHSQTSIQLTGYLASNRWHIAPEYIAMEDYSLLDRCEDGDAYLLIGDKVFDYEGRFRYKYDLAAEWMAQTHLPFAFAVWVGRKGLSYDVHDALEASLTYGVEHIYEAIAESSYASLDYAYDYLTQNIDFLLDADKRRALQKFWDYGLKVQPKVNPG